jgi:Zn-dependent alcohol dehydrogenase
MTIDTPIITRNSVMKVKAAISVEVGGRLVIDDLDIGDPGPTHVVVKQFATGVCHSQLHQMHNPALPRPMVLGHESTGEVIAKGRDVIHVNEGDRVMLTWVQRDRFENTPDPTPWSATYQGQQVRHGDRSPTGVFTWTETTIADQQYVVKLTDPDVPTDVTSIVGCAVMTGCGAVVNSARVRPGNSVAVIGAGGVGLCAVQAAYNLGAHPIIVVDLNDDKIAFAKRFGASIGINASQEDAVQRILEITHGGADFVFDALGLGSTTEQMLAATRPGVNGLKDGGTAVLVGVPHGTPATINARDLFVGKIFRGAPGGSCRPDRDLPMFVRWFREGRLPLDQLVTRRYTLDQINDACAALAHGEIEGRAIVEF